MAHAGKCLCGAVQFDVDEIHEIDVCHCNMCRNWNGGPYVGADIRGQVRFKSDETLKWYDSSEWAKRGFCSTCGTSLFYRLKEDQDFWSISAGVFDLPDGLSISKEIFVDEKPDYYNFSGDQPRYTGPEFLAMIQGQSDA
mmetsp:Transcript_28152/g.36825  ORF Transcript_28152/g.36825 Transcript_28152/m.36825 type:complete len:140 (-) Transcript_28152:2187-2606(-)